MAKKRAKKEPKEAGPERRTLADYIASGQVVLVKRSRRPASDSAWLSILDRAMREKSKDRPIAATYSRVSNPNHERTARLESHATIQVQTNLSDILSRVTLRPCETGGTRTLLQWVTESRSTTLCLMPEVCSLNPVGRSEHETVVVQLDHVERFRLYERAVVHKNGLWIRRDHCSSGQHALCLRAAGKNQGDLGAGPQDTCE